MNNKKTGNNSRIVSFDLLRIISTVLVINLHIHIIAFTKPNLLQAFAYYTVPLFLILSFYFMTKYFIRERLPYQIILPRIKRILLPFLFWSLMGFALHPELINIKNILLQMATGELVNVPLYYLFLLMLFTLIFWLLTYLNHKIRLIIYACIILIPLFLQYSLINYHLFSATTLVIKNSYGRFIELIPYAVVGLLFGLMSLKLKLKSVSFLFLTILFAILYSLALNLSELPGFHFSGIKIFLGTIAVFSFTLFLSNMQFNEKLNKLIRTLGKYSFGVYLFHFILLELLFKLSPYLTSYVAKFSLLFLFIYVFFCYSLCAIINKLTKRKFFFLIE